MQIVTCCTFLYNIVKSQDGKLLLFTVVNNRERKIMEIWGWSESGQREGEKALQTFHTCPCWGSIVTKQQQKRRLHINKRFFLNSHKHHVQECILKLLTELKQNIAAHSQHFNYFHLHIGYLKDVTQNFQYKHVSCHTQSTILKDKERELINW